MSTLVIIVALVGILGVLVAVVLGIAKPATQAGRNHRGPVGQERRSDPDGDPRTPSWRRALSLAELAILTVVVGMVAAGSVAAVALLVGSFLSTAI